MSGKFNYYMTIQGRRVGVGSDDLKKKKNISYLEG